ncbi:MAG: hypothetical protein PF447_03585 [Spirochaetaceae bacterium]|nr:hypothetical protein [Spirochaetaceae bacterium]
MLLPAGSYELEFHQGGQPYLLPIELKGQEAQWIQWTEDEAGLKFTLNGQDFL